MLSAYEPLSAEHDVSAFSCGKLTLDHWLKTRALSNQEKGSTAILVVHEGGCVIGYYGLADGRGSGGAAALGPHRGQPPDPAPCLLLGQLATDKAWAGRGIGTGLVKHALQRCVQAVNLIGGKALMVKAVDGEATQFWQRRGFMPSKDDPLVPFRSIAAIAASF